MVGPERGFAGQALLSRLNRQSGGPQDLLSNAAFVQIKAFASCGERVAQVGRRCQTACVISEVSLLVLGQRLGEYMDAHLNASPSVFLSVIRCPSSGRFAVVLVRI